MATADQLEKARTNINDILSVSVSDLISSPRWGTINFEDVRRHLELIRGLAVHLSELPIEIVPDNAFGQILDALVNCRGLVQRINGFDLARSRDVGGDRNNMASEARSYSDQLLTTSEHWIPFLAYQKGDVQKNIQELSSSVTNAKKILDDATVDVEVKKKQVDDIIAAAREASGRAGVAVFTKDFADQATTLKADAKNWLQATAALAGITVVAAVVSAFVPLPKDATNVTALHFMTSKLVALLVLLTATIWCGRIYKATLHQASLNQHRAHALTTFQAFVKAASDDSTKDAVLLETTRSIFSAGSSGYLDGAESSVDTTKVLEIFKNKPA